MLAMKVGDGAFDGKVADVLRIALRAGRRIVSRRVVVNRARESIGREQRQAAARPAAQRSLQRVVAGIAALLLIGDVGELRIEPRVDYLPLRVEPSGRIIRVDVVAQPQMASLRTDVTDFERE